MKKELIATAVVFACASSLMAGIAAKQAAQLDVDKDQKISKGEFVMVMTNGFDRKDTNKNGFLSIAEHAHPSFNTFDQNQDGKISRDEYFARFVKQFEDSHDKNKDGFITADEMQ